MTSRIVLFGATGYSGELVAQALVKRGQTPVLAGRNAARLSQMASDLGGLEYAVADVDQPQSVHALVGAGDVLLTTVGPFDRWGAPAVEAAVAQGAHYLDSTGEPPFIQQIFEKYGPKARARNVALLTAMAYDYVPGNLAAAHALNDAGGKATRVEVGYFVEGPITPGALSGGTLASLTGSLFDPGFKRTGGVLVAERAGVRWRKFDAAGTTRAAVSLGTSEHFSLPQSWPGLQDVDTYLGWFGPASRPLSFLSRTGGVIVALPPIKTVVNAVIRRIFRGSSGGPDAAARQKYTTVAVAETYDANGNQLGRATVRGLNPYDFTGEMLAWGAERLATVGPQSAGALGPVSAFGLDALADGARQCGLERID